jgi:hypothetical protein
MENLEKSNRQTNVSQQDEITKKWEDRFSIVLVGKTIKSVRYLYTVEKRDMGWFKKSLVIFFTDGSFIFPSSNNEGNDTGAYFTLIKDMEVIPTL